jgi:hypothetical protein
MQPDPAMKREFNPVFETISQLWSKILINLIDVNQYCSNIREVQE